MASFEYLETVTTEEGEGQPATFAQCLIHGRYDEEQPENLTINVEVKDDQGRHVHLEYLLSDDGAGFALKLVRTGEPLIDYGICVARKVGVAIAKAAIECYYDHPGNWYAFYVCMRGKAPALGLRGARALITCVFGIVGLDWD